MKMVHSMRLAAWIVSISVCFTPGSLVLFDSSRPMAPPTAAHTDARAGAAFVQLGDARCWETATRRCELHSCAAFRVLFRGFFVDDGRTTRPRCGTVELRAKLMRNNNNGEHDERTTGGFDGRVTGKWNNHDQWRGKGSAAVQNLHRQQKGDGVAPSIRTARVAAPASPSDDVSSLRQILARGNKSWRGSAGKRLGSMKFDAAGRGRARHEFLHEETSKAGLSHAKSGQPVEVKYENSWHPAVIVGLTRPTEVVVQYVGGNEHCREAIDLRSERLRPLKVKGSGTMFRTGDATRLSGVKLQLEWCAQIAADAAERGRPWASVPVVASQSAIGWRRRREDEMWYGSWALSGRRGDGGAGRRTIMLGRLPRDLASFTSLTDLLNALEEARADGLGHFGAKHGVIAMNHIKRLSWQCQREDVALKGRMKDTMRHFAVAAAQGMDRLSSKDVALLLNAVTSVLDVRSECPGLRTQDEAGSASSPSPAAEDGAAPDARTNSRDSCVFWGMFDKASHRLLRLDTLYTAHTMAGVSDADNPGKFTSQGVAMVANALSHAGIRDEPLLHMLASVVMSRLSPHEYTAQSVSLIASAFDRLSFNDSAVFQRLADVAVAVPARSYDGQALSCLLWALSRSGSLCGDTRLLRKTEDMIHQMPLRKWKLPYMCRALQAISSAHAKLVRRRESSSMDMRAGGAAVDEEAKMEQGKRPAGAADGHDVAAVEEALDDVARALFGYVALHVSEGSVELAGGPSCSPTTMAVLAAECVRARERGWLSSSDCGGVLSAVARAVIWLSSTCVHAFSHADVAMLLGAHLRARPPRGAGKVSLPPDYKATAAAKAPNGQRSADSVDAGEEGDRDLWRSMAHVLAELPMNRASASELVAVLQSFAQAGEAGLLADGDKEKQAVVLKFVQRLSTLEVGYISPPQVAAAVVSAARCNMRDEEAVRELAATAARMLTREVESMAPVDVSTANPLETSLVSSGDGGRRGVGGGGGGSGSSSSSGGGGISSSGSGGGSSSSSSSAEKCPFPHHLIPGLHNLKPRPDESTSGLETPLRDDAPVVQRRPAAATAAGFHAHQQERMSQSDIAALVRAVAYLNIPDRHLLSCASTVLRQRASCQQPAVSAGAAAARVEAEARSSAQTVANMAWAAAVMGGVDVTVHEWLGSWLQGASLASLSSEQVHTRLSCSVDGSVCAVFWVLECVCSSPADFVVGVDVRWYFHSFRASTSTHFVCTN